MVELDRVALALISSVRLPARIVAGIRIRFYSLRIARSVLFFFSFPFGRSSDYQDLIISALCWCLLRSDY